MNRINFISGIMTYLLAGGLLIVRGETVSDRTVTLQNRALAREFSINNGHLRTLKIINKRADTVLTPLACDEFQMRLSEGTGTTGTDRILTSADFTCVEVDRGELDGGGGDYVGFRLQSGESKLAVYLRYELRDDEFYMRKQLWIESEIPVTLERLDVEAVRFADAYQPYTHREITTQASGRPRSKWRPGLGQPLFTTETASFWGVEFPAADNRVIEQELLCGYQYGKELIPGKTYRSYQAVMGVGDDPAHISEAFYAYIEAIRVRPLRLQIQYNSWFDYKKEVSREKFISSVEKVNRELCVKRGVPPLNAYVIDDGWHVTGQGADWSQEVWPVNEKFDPRFESSFRAAEAAGSELGIWLSPQANFGARLAVPSMRKAGMGALDTWMSLADTPYMDKLEDRLVELTEQGFSYFKLDGTFGHLRMREFDIHGAKHGVPEMPQLDTDGFSTTDKRLNDSKYDELKIYYLTVGTERLIKIFKAMGEVNPEVYIVISNGAYLSPWWLMYCDAVWMINAGDAAGGSGRTEEIVYRDSIYHDIWVKEKTHFPMNALFNHEPKKTETGESEDEFRRYLYMNLSRGTGFIELYLTTDALSEKDWDVLAEGLRWVREIFPAFTRSRMHGGDPRRKEVYGFTGWTADQGYLSVHNPSDTPQPYSMVLDRAFGLLPDNPAQFQVSSPLEGDMNGVPKTVAFGDTITMKLQPGEIRVLTFAN